MLSNKIWIDAFIQQRLLDKGIYRTGNFLRLQEEVSMDNFAQEDEPQGNEGQSMESEYSIEHPLIGDQSQNLVSGRAMDLFVESVKCIQDGNEMKASTLYQEALKAEPSLHTHARDALSNMIQLCSPESEGAVYYWLGIHSEYLEDNDQAVIWYEKAIDAFHKIGYRKREARAHCNLGTVKMQLKDPSGMEEYEKAVTLNPMDGIAHISMGMAYYITDDYERALDTFADAVWADPTRYGPLVISRLQRFGYTWKEDVAKIGQRVAKKQGIDLDTLTASEREDSLQGYHYFEIGNGFFQSGRYREALEQFEKGKVLTRKFPGNYFGVSMTTMQMIEVGAIPRDQIPFYLEKAEQNIDECLRIAPTHLDYLKAKNIIRDYKSKYRVS
jgi:tetratricopeptide (TPR) repeat protein